jgi:transmembrane sensor
MNPTTARRLTRYVEPEVDEVRIDRVWARLAPVPHAPRIGTRFQLALAAGLVSVAAVSAVYLAERRVREPVGGIVFESGEAQAITLPDGSRVALGPSTRVKCDRVDRDRVEATLERGDARFEVRHAEGRLFTVHAGEFDVVDRGTRFEVSLSGGRVRVHVEEGSVGIVRAGQNETPRVLAAGESWESGEPRVALEPASAASAAVVQGPAPSAEPAREPERTPAPAFPGPRELLAEAQSARAAGRARDAATALDTLRKRFRGDPRAGLAAFELGRLRLDTLGDPAGAVDALDDAIALGPSASFREDADARLVEALDRLHNPRCAVARRAYLQRYPNGVYAAAVGTRCSP